ncbi:hypothetical protein Dimus_015624 [Dionaea muscipula]
MIDNSLSNVMDLIKRQKWEKLFKRRKLMHIDAVKEFYARLTLVHYKKKDVVRSSGESGSDDQFYDAQVEVEESVAEAPAVPVFPASPGDSSNQQKEKEAAGVDPSGPTGHIPDSVMIQLQADFERAQANRIQADLEKAQAENARLLALLQQAQSQPKS